MTTVAPSTWTCDRERAVAWDTLPDRARASQILRGLNAQAGRFGPVTVDRQLVLYGAGNLGKLAKAHLDQVGVPIAAVVDARAESYQDDPDWAGIPVIVPQAVSEATKREALLAVSIVTSPFMPLKEQLEAAGWARCVPFYDVAEGFRDRHPLSNGWFGAPLDGIQLSRCEAAIEGWDDAVSRAHHLAFAAWRLCREEWSFSGADVTPSSRFFIDAIRSRLTAEERVLDAGAHHGSFLACFLEKTGGAFSEAWAIEPDPQSRAVLASWVKGLDARTSARIAIHDAVLGSQRETARFHAGLGYASQISDTGQMTRNVVPIDALDVAPTFIKLHLEGAEHKALQGAQATIRRHRPIIVATTYHDDNGLAETPLWLMRNLDNYRVSMRMHGWCGTGLVVYAIPKERAVRSA